MTVTRLSPADLRLQTTGHLAGEGFRAAGWLPLSEESFELRPRDEIVARLMALNVVFLWGASSDGVTPTTQFWPYIETNALQPYLTQQERGIIAVDRIDAHRQFLEEASWRLESMWSLAWILGFDHPPTINSGLMHEDVARPLVEEFVGYLDKPRDEILHQSQVRDEADVVAMEDRFYAAHNAVRTALADPTAGTVPEGYPVELGAGCIHHRRHALTWAVSPDTTWDETDLSS